MNVVVYAQAVRGYEALGDQPVVLLPGLAVWGLLCLQHPEKVDAAARILPPRVGIGRAQGVLVPAVPSAVPGTVG